jgi:HEAT repeat protein
MLRTLSLAAGLLAAGHARVDDPPQIAGLVRRLEAGGPGERVIAAERLRELGPRAADAVPTLARVAQVARRGSAVGDAESSRANRYLYTATVEALAAIGPKAAPALVELMPGESDDWFGGVAGHVGSLGPDAGPVIPALAKLLAHDSQDLRVRTARALERIGPPAEPAAPALVDLFFNPQERRRQPVRVPRIAAPAAGGRGAGPRADRAEGRTGAPG